MPSERQVREGDPTIPYPELQEQFATLPTNLELRLVAPFAILFNVGHTPTCNVKTCACICMNIIYELMQIK